MPNHLTTIGDRPALILEPEILESAGIDAGAPLEVTVDADDHRARVLASARRMMEIHDETFRKLAR